MCASIERKRSFGNGMVVRIGFMEHSSSHLLKTTRPVGLAAYGAYVPRYRLPAVEVARVWAGGKTGGLPIKEKAVAGLDEDVITMSIEAGRNALARAQIDPQL